VRDLVARGCRGDRAELFNYWWKPRPPLVARYKRFEIRERIGFDGSVSAPLVEEDVIRAAELVKARDIESVAICFLNSFANDAHEQAAKEIIAEHLPGIYVCASSELVPEILEVEHDRRERLRWTAHGAVLRVDARGAWEARV
jgi:N-methylhydantoinase A